MKARNIIIFLVTNIWLSSCSDTLFENRDGQLVSHEPQRLTAKIIQGTTPVSTRATMLDTPGQSVALKWQDGDNIGVFGSKAGTNVAYKISASDIYNSGRTATFQTNYDGTDGDLLGYFPYDKSATLDGSGNLVLTMPAVQNYTEKSFTASPEASYCIMAGKGTTKDGVKFRTVTSLLKIGLISEVKDRRQKVRRVLFRDLADQPVTGPFAITWTGEEPTTTFSGGGKALTLDCGDAGVVLDTARICPFFLSVPARHYAKGFELTFEMTDGSKLTKTIGKTAGKTLLRSVVYPIGDFAQDTFENCSTKLKPNALIVDADLIDKIINTELYFHDGLLSGTNFITIDDTSNEIQKDQFLLFMPSETFPYGMAVKVVSVTPFQNSTIKKVTIQACDDFAEAFEEIKIGEPFWNEDGTFIEGKGLQIDLNKYLQKIILPDGEEAYFDREGDEIVMELPFENDYDKDWGQVSTRGLLDDGMAKLKDSFTTPTLSVKLGKDDPEAEDPSKRGHGSIYLGAKVRFKTNMVLTASDGALQYVGLSITPIIKAKCDFTLSGEVSAGTGDKYLFTALFGGLAIGPIPITFECDFFASASIGGQIELKGTVNYQKTLNSYGFSYAKGSGFTGRSHFVQPDEEEGFNAPDVGLTGTMYVKGTITAQPKVKIYGLFEAGVKAPMDMKLELTALDAKNGFSLDGLKLSLVPGIGLQPYVGTLAGRYTKTFKDFANIEFEPIWERWITPKIEDIKLWPEYTYVPESEMMIRNERSGYEYLDYSFPTNNHCPRNGIRGINYSITVSRKLLKEIKLGVAIYKGSISYDKFNNYSTGGYYMEHSDYYKSYGMPEEVGQVDIIREFLDPEFITILPIDSYKQAGEDDDDKITLSGLLPYGFENGQGYGMELVAYLGSETTLARRPYYRPSSSAVHWSWDLSISNNMFFNTNKWITFTGGGTLPFICNWPFFADGTPWPRYEYVPE